MKKALQAAIVDSSGNSVGNPDGSGGITLTKAQYDAGIKLQPRLITLVILQ